MNNRLKQGLSSDICGNYIGFSLVYIQDGMAYPVELNQADIDELNEFVRIRWSKKRMRVTDEPIAEIRIFEEENMQNDKLIQEDFEDNE